MVYKDECPECGMTLYALGHLKVKRCWKCNRIAVHSLYEVRLRNVGILKTVKEGKGLGEGRNECHE